MSSRSAQSSARTVAALAVLLAVSPVALGPVAVGPAAAADARLTLIDTTVTPATPTVGAPITAETTLRFSAGSNTSMTVEEVRVVDPSDGEDGVLGTATGLGRLSPGETLDVPVTFTVNESGTQDLQLVAIGTDVDGDRVRATRPLTVGVEQGSPQVELETDSFVAGADTAVQATVSNPTTAPLRDIEVVADGSRAAIPTLAAGASQTVNLTAVLPEAGAETLGVTTTYTTPTGVRLDTRTTESVTVDSLRTDVGLRTARPQDSDTQQAAGDLTGLIGGGGTDALQSQSDGERAASGSRVDVTVTNFGNAAVDDVVLTAEDGEGARLAAVGRFAAADTLAPGEETTVTVDLSRVQSVEELRFVARYQSPRGTNETALVYGYSAQRGEASLTGIDVSVTENGRVSIDGNLANVGDGEVTSAVVSVGSTDTVEPAYPRRDYFVGTVDASAFAPFQLTAQADVGNATRVPLQVTYTAGGEQVSRMVNVTLPPPTTADDGGPLSAGVTAALLVGLLVLGAGGAYVTRYRDR